MHRSRFSNWLFHLCFSVSIGLLMIQLSGCAFKSIKRSKNITYTGEGKNVRFEQQLNIFAPRDHKKPHDVLIYVYGGNWTSGRKSLYNFFGSRWARKGVVTVIVDYPKSPNVAYKEMATDVALAVKWVKDHIAEYGGNPDKIFISGHSAGGHLAALVTVKKEYFEKLDMPNPIKGMIFIDAAGLDMYGYMKEVDYGPQGSYINIFSQNPATWKEASPLYQMHYGMPPMLVYVGGRTYPSIDTGNRKWVDSLKRYNVPYTYHLLKKKRHVGMITQFFNTGNKRYGEIRNFMRTTK